MTSGPDSVYLDGVGVLKREFLVKVLVGLTSSPEAGSLLALSTTQPLAPFQFGSDDLFSDAVTRALDHRRGVDGYSRKTISSMRTAVNSFRGFLGEAKSAERFLRGDATVQRQLLHGWTAHVRSRSGSHDTVNNYWRSLKTLFGAIAEARCTYSPFTGLRPPRPGQRRIRAITQESLYRVYDFLVNRQCRSEFERLRDLAVFALAAMAGLRNGEIRRLAVSEIDVGTGAVHVSRSKGRFGGKDRVAQLVGDALPIVQAYSAARQRLGRTHREFISSLSRDRPLSEKALLGIFRRVEGATGVFLRPHMCRHTYNVILERAGVRDAARLELLGHTKLAALQYYTHAFAGEATAAARAINLGLDTRSLRLPSTKERDPCYTSREVLAPDAGVAHCRHDARVPREGLNDMNGRPPFEQERAEGMAQRMNTEGDSRGTADGPDDPDEARF